VRTDKLPPVRLKYPTVWTKFIAAEIMADVSVQTQSQSNRGRRRPRGRGGKGGARAKDAVAIDPTTDSNAQARDGVKADGDTGTAAGVSASQTEEQEDDGQDLCWICAEPVKYYAVSECNHRTCHVCALRLRALYKKLDCTFCKVRVTSIHVV
jgi:hypothetical protein